jgi:CRP-like cAMP-binding protein
MRGEDLRALMSASPCFERLLLRYALALFDQSAQHAACNRLHALEERCARWLLMTHDRVDGDVLPLKQQFLAEMLGVHRPAVTLAAGALQRAGVIRYTRGKVTVLDRPALERASCECYAIIMRRTERLLDGR